MAHFGEMSVRGNVVRGTVCRGNVRSENCPFGELSFGELSSGKSPSGNCLDTNFSVVFYKNNRSVRCHIGKKGKKYTVTIDWTKPNLQGKLIRHCSLQFYYYSRVITFVSSQLFRRAILSTPITKDICNKIVSRFLSVVCLN